MVEKIHLVVLHLLEIHMPIIRLEYKHCNVIHLTLCFKEDKNGALLT